MEAIRFPMAFKSAFALLLASIKICLNILLLPLPSEYHSGAIITPLMPLAPCTKLSHYAIQSALDAGGIGEVYQARLRNRNVGSLLRSRVRTK